MIGGGLCELFVLRVELSVVSCLVLRLFVGVLKRFLYGFDTLIRFSIYGMLRLLEC